MAAESLPDAVAAESLPDALERVRADFAAAERLDLRTQPGMDQCHICWASYEMFRPPLRPCYICCRSMCILSGEERSGESCGLAAGDHMICRSCVVRLAANDERELQAALLPGHDIESVRGCRACGDRLRCECGKEVACDSSVDGRTGELATAALCGSCRTVAVPDPVIDCVYCERSESIEHI